MTKKYKNKSEEDLSVGDFVVVHDSGEKELDGFRGDLLAADTEESKWSVMLIYNSLGVQQFGDQRVRVNIHCKNLKKVKRTPWQGMLSQDRFVHGVKLKAIKYSASAAQRMESGPSKTHAGWYLNTVIPEAYYEGSSEIDMDMLTGSSTPNRHSNQHNAECMGQKVRSAESNQQTNQSQKEAKLRNQIKKPSAKNSNLPEQTSLTTEEELELKRRRKRYKEPKQREHTDRDCFPSDRQACFDYYCACCMYCAYSRQCENMFLFGFLSPSALLVSDACDDCTGQCYNWCRCCSWCVCCWWCCCCGCEPRPRCCGAAKNKTKAIHPQKRNVYIGQLPAHMASSTMKIIDNDGVHERFDLDRRGFDSGHPGCVAEGKSVEEGLLQADTSNKLELPPLRMPPHLAHQTVPQYLRELQAPSLNKMKRDNM
jgi:hypothetical protein